MSTRPRLLFIIALLAGSPRALGQVAPSETQAESAKSPADYCEEVEVVVASLLEGYCGPLIDGICLAEDGRVVTRPPAGVAPDRTDPNTSVDRLVWDCQRALSSAPSDLPLPFSVPTDPDRVLAEDLRDLMAELQVCNPELRVVEQAVGDTVRVLDPAWGALPVLDTLPLLVNTLFEPPPPCIDPVGPPGS